MAIHFPNAAYQGESYLAENGVEYIYDGVKWVGAGSATNIIPDHLNAANVSLHLFSNGVVQMPTAGTINVPTRTSDVFTLAMTASNYVATDAKPVLTLTGDPWVLHGSYEYNAYGETEILLDNIWPILDNPGYESEDAFTFGEAVHGISGHVLTLQLNDVVLPGGAGWTANPAVSQPPVYPSTIASLAAIKFTSNDNDMILGIDGSVKLTGALYVENTLEGAIIGENGIAMLAKNGTPMYMTWERGNAENPYPNATPGLVDATSVGIAASYSGVTIEVNGESDNGYWSFQPNQKLKMPPHGDIVFSNGVSALGGGASGGSNYSNADVASYLPTYSGNIAGNIVQNGYTWTFGTDGTTTFPTGGRITSSGKGGTSLDGGLDGGWTSLTNYYANGNYSSCVTGYSNGRLYITTYNDGGDNPSREWAFDNYGNLTLPPNGYILNSDLTVYGGSGTGSSLPVNSTGWPTILKSSSDGQTVSWGQNSSLEFNGYSIYMSGNQCTLNFQQGGSLFAQLAVNANVYNPQSVGNVKITSNKFQGEHNWLFGTNGNLTLPAGGTINWSDGSNALTGGSSIGHVVNLGSTGIHAPDLQNYSGEKVVLWDLNNHGNIYNYSIGIEADNTWFGVDDSNAHDQGFKWYRGNVQIMQLARNGNLTFADGGVLTNVFNETTLLNANGVAMAASIGNAIAVSEEYGAAVYVNNNAWQFQANANVILPPGGYILNSDNTVYGQSNNVTANVANVGTQHVSLSTDLSVLIDNLTGNILYIYKNQFYSGTDEHAILLNVTPPDGTRIVLYNETDLIANVHYGDLYYAMDPTARLEMAYTYYQGSPGWLPLQYTLFTP